MILQCFTPADNLTLITIVVSALGIIITFLLGYNIYVNIEGVRENARKEAKKVAEESIKDIKIQQTRTIGFLQLVSSYQHEYNGSRELALNAAKIALDSFNNIDDARQQVIDTQARIDELNRNEPLNSFGVIIKRIEKIEDRMEY